MVVSHYSIFAADLLTLDAIILMCPSNVKDVSNTSPKYSCDEICWTGLFLKKIGGS